ncbi:unnamed protein product [Symbiodinium sp. CCMP2456]|nr:unnamed protein product [Symbiodinium sp. CCMP2456]
MFTCQKLQQELRDLRHELDSEAIIHRSKAAAQEVLLAAERTERQKLEERPGLNKQMTGNVPQQKRGSGDSSGHVRQLGVTGR